PSDFVIDEDGSLTAYTGTDSVVEIPSGVTVIRDNVFKNNETITKVIIPDGVTKIQSDVFHGCVNLESVAIPDSVTSIGTYTFYECTSLRHISLPANLTNLGYSAFQYSGLVSIEIPDGIKTVSHSAFRGCKSLVFVKLPAKLEKIDNFGFGDCESLTEIVMPDTVKTIGYNVFDNCSGLVSLRLSSALEKLEDSTFYNCDNLLYVTIPEGITKIAKKAFYNCDGLIGVSLPSTLKEIDESAFNGCSELMNLKIPEGVTAIGNNAFSYCVSLYALQIPKTVTSIGKSVIPTGYNRLQTVYYTGSSAQWKQIETNESKESIEEKLVTKGAIDANELFAPSIPYGFSKNSEKNSNGSDGFVISDGVLVKYTGSAREVVIPSGVTFISSNAFKDNEQIKKVTIPDGVFGIGKSAFSGCAALQEVTIPDSVVTIGNYAFNECKALTAVDLPDGLFQINANAFYQCTSLSDVAFSAGLLSIGPHAFYGAALPSLDLSEINLLVLKDQAFRFCKKMKTCRLPDTMLSVGENAFDGNTALQKAVLPADLKMLKTRCFASCTSLSEITIPGSIKELENGLFFDCDALTRVQIPEGVEIIGEGAFSSADVLEAILPSTLKEISKDAFYNCFSMKAVLLPENLEKIGEKAFYYCSALKYIYLPESLSDVAAEAFGSCYKITDVYYGGTQEQWQALGGDAIFPQDANVQMTFGSDPAALQQQFTVYRISYELDGGIGYSTNPRSYTPMDEDFKINKPSKSGYYFVGWLTGGQDGGEPQREITIKKGTTGDKHYIAVWTWKYKITYKDDDGENLSTTNPTTYTALDGKIKLADPKKSGFLFSGWTGSNGNTPQKELEFDASEGGDRTYIANWQELYKIGYDLDGGTVSGTNPASYSENDADIQIINPVKGETKFLGWIGTGITGDPVTQLVIPHGSKGNRGYTAVWEGGSYDQDTYIIEYELNGGTMEGNPASYTSKDTDIVIKRPYKENFEFMGWFTFRQVGGTNLDPVICHGSRGDLKFWALFELCDHEEMKTEPGKDPTCTEDGLTEGKHCGCGKINIPGEVIPALGHLYDEGVVTKAPTANEKGIKTFTCTRCKNTYTEEIPALGSGTGQPGDGRTVSGNDRPGSGNGQPGSGPGTDGQTALKKGDVFKTKTGTFRVTKTGKKPEASFLAPASAKKKTVTVPATAKKYGVTYKVTSIAANAFAKNKKLKKVTIGKNIKTIGKKAFFKCKNLKKITVKTKVLKKIGKYAFKGIHKKAAFKFPKNREKKYKKLLKKSKSNLPRI
ncbi:MAG: leucine-rich repeat protein, partial [Lachnospiraceae bacterium]|nr:leucine-rich repeat protein [Lachnospiraceae bacterium]